MSICIVLNEKYLRPNYITAPERTQIGDDQNTFSSAHSYMAFHRHIDNSQYVDGSRLQHDSVMSLGCATDLCSLDGRSIVLNFYFERLSDRADCNILNSYVSISN